jgi:hypothetical protein
MTDDELKLAQNLKARRDNAITASNRANQAADHLETHRTDAARKNLSYLIDNCLSREEIETISALAVAWTAKRLKQAQEAYEKA